MSNRSTNLESSDYILSTGCAINELRVLIEGAVYLYTDETDPIYRLTLSHEQYRAAQIFSSIGEALYLLQSRIRDMQTAYTEEFKRQIEDVSSSNLIPDRASPSSAAKRPSQSPP